MVLDVFANSAFEIGNARVRTAANLLARDLSKESFDLVEPTRACGCKVHLESRVKHQPTFYYGVLVRRVVI